MISESIRRPTIRTRVEDRRSVTQKNKDRKKIDRDVRIFLAMGGTIQVVEYAAKRPEIERPYNAGPLL